MTVVIGPSSHARGYLKSPFLIISAFATAFFPRILSSMGFPSAINFVHFAVVPLVLGITLFNVRNKSKKATSTTQLLLVGLFILLLNMAISALVNGAGLVNLFVGYMLLAEPFLFLIILVYTPINSSNLKWLKNWVLIFGLSNTLLAIAQHFLIQFGILAVTSMTREDNVQGVFYLSGAGHVVSSAVALTFAIYYFASARKSPLLLRTAVVSAATLHFLFADAKQVLLVFLVAWGVLILIKLTDPRIFIQYVIAAVLVGYSLLWAMQNIPLFRAFNTWIRPGLYGPDGEATLLKVGGFPIISSFYETPLNWLWGLGPGHTVGRLGGWMIKEYAFLLGPLGSTSHPASEAVWDTWHGHWLDSSFFSPLFGWIGVWGDFGILGLAAYLFLWWIVWQFLCKGDFPKYCVITVFIFGFIFTQLEEPGYMLTITTLIGLRWHELRAQERKPNPQVYARVIKGGDQT